MSLRDVREDSFASPLRARSLLTVRAAISLARFVEAPLFFSLSLMCSYWRSRLLLHAFCGIENLPSWDISRRLCAHFQGFQPPLPMRNRHESGSNAGAYTR